VTEEEFIALLDERGGERDLWPVALLPAADGLLENSARARAALQAMQRAEALLSVAADHGTFNAIAIAAKASRRAQQQTGIHPLSLMAAGALALAMGILIGMTPTNDSALIGSMQAALNGDTSDAW
jgi:hypothetical protein